MTIDPTVIISGIAQILASLFAFSAVFLVLRLEGLIRPIGEYKTRAINILRVRERFDSTYKVPHISEQSASRIIQDLKSLQSDYPTIGVEQLTIDIHEFGKIYEPDKKLTSLEFLNNTLIQLDSLEERRVKAIEHVSRPGAVAGFTIILSTFLLGFGSDWIDRRHVYLVAFFAILSLVLLLRSAWKLLKAAE